MFESAGLTTVAIALVREHAEAGSSLRARFWVPFLLLAMLSENPTIHRSSAT